MQLKIKRQLHVLIGAISLCILGGSFNPALTESTSFDNKPLEQIELEVEEAVVARGRTNIESNFDCTSSVETLHQELSWVSPNRWFSGHRFGNGLMAPLLI